MVETSNSLEIFQNIDNGNGGGFDKKEFTFIFIILLAFFKALSVSLLGIGLPNYLLYDLNTTSALAGYSNAVFCIPYAIFPFVLSKWTDKIGRKRGLIISVVSSSMIYVFFLTDFSLMTALILRFLDGLATSLFWPILQASLSDIKDIEPEKSEKRIYHYNLGWNGGILFGLIFGALAVFLMQDNKIIFTISVISTFCMLPAIYFLKLPSNTLLNTINIQKNQNNQNNQNNQTESANITTSGIILHSIPLSIPIIAILIHSTSIGSLGILLPSKLEFYMYPSFVIYVLSMFRASSTTLNTKMVSKISNDNIKKYTIFSGLGLFLVILMFSLFINLYLYAFLLILLGLFTMTLYSNSLRIFLDKNAKEHTAKYTGIFEAVIGVGFGIGPIATGLGADLNIDVTFIFLSIYILVLTLIVYLLFNKYLKN